MTTRLLGNGGRSAIVPILLLALAAPSHAQEHEFAAQLTELAQGKLREIARNETIVAAVTAQNASTAGYDAARIDELDKQWGAEVDAASKPLIDAALGSAASRLLLQLQEEAAGLYTEIFVMDAKGLNVAQSTITSDYWQGDEDKFTQSFGAGPEAVHLGEIEEDESTQVFQSQVSITVTDAGGTPIGALTVGIDLSQI